MTAHNRAAVFGPLLIPGLVEAAALWAAHMQGLFVWSVVIVGLSGIGRATPRRKVGQEIELQWRAEIDNDSKKGQTLPKELSRQPTMRKLVPIASPASTMALILQGPSSR